MKREITDKKELERTDRVTNILFLISAAIALILIVYIFIRHNDPIAMILCGGIIVFAFLCFVSEEQLFQKRKSYDDFKEKKKLRPMPEEISKMNGKEFEQFTAKRLKEAGWNNVSLTKHSGDRGVDVIAEKNGEIYAFQCKNWKSPVGTKVLQEVYFGKESYGATRMIVISARGFSKNTLEMAKEREIELWTVDELLSLQS